MTSQLPIPQASITTTAILHTLRVGCRDWDEMGPCMTSLISSFHAETLDFSEALGKMLCLFEMSAPGFLSYLEKNGAPVKVHDISYSQFNTIVATGTSPIPQIDFNAWALHSVMPEAMAVTRPTSVHAAAALVWMAYAKSAGDSSRRAYEVARPKAMIGRFQIPDGDADILPGGPSGPILEALDQVNLGATMFEHIRYLITAYMMSITTQTTFVPLSLHAHVMMFQMLANTGMTHVGAIAKLVEMQPWVLGIPELAAEFLTFAGELDKMAQYPPSVRPYHRLLYPQTQFLFVSSTLRPLIAVAGEFITEVEDNFKNYIYDSDKYASLVGKVRARQPVGFHISNTQTLAAKFGVSVIPPAAPVQLPTTGPIRTTV